ncbi:hypothetical protein [Roseibium sediminicola]|uniref:Tic20 family protein n=1 Tax=Roseibium sediminicola TaxID=2933272 RepID=A0ABT0GNB5_9HYPH|nr:hypothetical protein [Roseibium sp. CAU 1639]MCK7610921.1 hypothetical protein [Roseibium sp. CAU 1639]
MTGRRSRFPAAGEPDHRRSRQRRTVYRFPATVFRPGPANICLCHILVASLALAPLALIFSVWYADPGARWLEAHYLYLRTSIALLVIGAGLGSLMILLGAPLSSLLMLGGLALIAATLLLTLARCCNGFFRTLFGRPLRDPKSYLV